MQVNQDVLRGAESAVMELMALYRKYGYTRFKMSRFEEYDLYANNKDFLVSDRIITFTDTNGKLMALKPDVTMSIIKNSADRPDCVQKVYYNENVYRVSRRRHAFEEIMQAGLECVGKIGLYDLCEVIQLAVRSLGLISDRYVLDVSHLGFVSGILRDLPVSQAQRAQILGYIGQKNAAGIEDVCRQAELDEKQIASLVAMTRIYGPMRDTLVRLEAFDKNEQTSSALAELNDISRVLARNGMDQNIQLDFSVVNDMNYYNGMVFAGYVEGVAEGILSGGQYDKLLHKLGKKAGAVGFAVYLDELERLDRDENAFDVDVLVLYDEKEDVEALASRVRELADSGKRVMAQRIMPPGVRYRRLATFSQGRLIYANADA